MLKWLQHHVITATTPVLTPGHTWPWLVLVQVIPSVLFSFRLSSHLCIYYLLYYTVHYEK